MAKKKIRVTDAMVDAAEPYVTSVVTRKLTRMGAAGGLKRWKSNGDARRRATKRAYQDFLDAGGRVGDWESFLTWLLENGDKIIAFISKIIALFVTVCLALMFSLPISGGMVI